MVGYCKRTMGTSWTTRVYHRHSLGLAVPCEARLKGDVQAHVPCIVWQDGQLLLKAVVHGHLIAVREIQPPTAASTVGKVWSQALTMKSPKVTFVKIRC